VANFTANRGNYTIAVSASPSAGGMMAGAGTFASGSSQTVTATPNSGYTFANWTENSAVVSAAASYTFTLTANRTLVANFSAGTPITLGENTVFSGVDSGNGNLLAVQDATLTQTATINSLSFYVRLADANCASASMTPPVPPAVRARSWRRPPHSLQS